MTNIIKFTCNVQCQLGKIHTKKHNLEAASDRRQAFPRMASIVLLPEWGFKSGSTYSAQTHTHAPPSPTATIIIIELNFLRYQPTEQRSESIFSPSRSKSYGAFLWQELFFLRSRRCPGLAFLQSRGWFLCVCNEMFKCVCVCVCVPARGGVLLKEFH